MIILNGSFHSKTWKSTIPIAARRADPAISPERAHIVPAEKISSRAHRPVKDCASYQYYARASDIAPDGNSAEDRPDQDSPRGSALHCAGPSAHTASGKKKRRETRQVSVKFGSPY